MSEKQPYDDIADLYRDSKQLGFRHFVERHTVLEALGDLQGRAVLDLACGEGIYARAFKRAGAARVTGVDISAAMVALASAQEEKEPLGCRYVHEDAGAFAPDEPVDVVTAIYLLNYARTREELARFARACFRALRPGGRLVGFNDNVRRPPRPGADLSKYGIERTCAWPPREGEVVRYSLTNDDGQAFVIDNYYLDPAAYEEAMRGAGFTDFRWIDAALAPGERGDPYWDDFMLHAPFIAFGASRP